MLQKKTYELFSGISNVFGVAEDILIAGFDEWCNDHNETLEKGALGVQTGKSKA